VRRRRDPRHPEGGGDCQLTSIESKRAQSGGGLLATPGCLRVTLVPNDLSVVVNGVALALRVWPCASPTGPSVMLLPGTGATAEDWDVVATGLCDERPVFAVDLRGHGRSDWPGTYSIQLLADDVSGALEHLGGGPFDLIGHSLGGLVACKVAAARPSRVHALVLEDVGLPHPRHSATPARPEGQLRFDWAVVEQVRPEIDDPDPLWGDIVSGIQAPTLVIAGGSGSFVPQRHVAELVERLPDARLVTIEAGHHVHANRPEEFIQQLRTFLNS
jgi:pimeloyl-ACP methyl ester carboxylesterase